MFLGCSIKYENEEEAYLGVVKRAISLDINTFMFYSGSAIGGKKPSIEDMQIDEGRELLKKYNFNEDHLVIHAPFNINLCNTIKPYVYNRSIRNLLNEIKYADYLGIKLLVLHPGHHLGKGFDKGADNLIKGLNKCFQKTQGSNVVICLETMVGKASEVGRTFEELAYIISGIDDRYKKRIAICLDTCHIHDHGYNLGDKESLINEFDRVIGLRYLRVIHLNDSKSKKNTALKNKDRHECIGLGSIGFDNLLSILYDKRLTNVSFILETPCLDNDYQSRKKEISMLKNKKYEDGWENVFISKII